MQQGFAVRLLGWSFHVEDARDTTSHLMLDGLISGGERRRVHRRRRRDRQRHAVFDLGVVGLLGVGQIDVIPDDKGSVEVDYADPGLTCFPPRGKPSSGAVTRVFCSARAMGSAGTERRSGT
ncbi:MAG: hypothetical protein CM15mP128_0990 [Methanobacteriota archaeon]|nr:MAG: hypothetical protein CM15mP128_0990 [Euryarchaeota archaeon]